MQDGGEVRIMSTVETGADPAAPGVSNSVQIQIYNTLRRQ
jgi:hypothetical protein